MIARSVSKLSVDAQFRRLVQIGSQLPICRLVQIGRQRPICRVDAAFASRKSAASCGFAAPRISTVFQ
jgi:hypothetical protein